MAWSEERIKRNITEKHPWMSPAEVAKYMELKDAAKRRSYIKTLEYYRRKDNV